MSDHMQSEPLATPQADTPLALDALTDAAPLEDAETSLADTLEASTNIAEDTATKESTQVFALPYYTTPEGTVRIALDHQGAQLMVPALSDILMEDHMTMQPLTNNSDNSAVTVNLGVHKNAPPLQATDSAAPTERIWLDADSLVPTAGGLPSLEEGQPAYTAEHGGESYMLAQQESDVMEAALTRLDGLQSSTAQDEPIKINIKVNNVATSPALHKEPEVPGTASALNALHAAVNNNATDRGAALSA